MLCWMCNSGLQVGCCLCGFVLLCGFCFVGWFGFGFLVWFVMFVICLFGVFLLLGCFLGGLVWGFVSFRFRICDGY